MRAKWERLYRAEGGSPPWCSAKPSTHLSNFLRSGSVRGGVPQPVGDLGCGSNGANVAFLASHGYRAAGVDFVGDALDLGCGSNGANVALLASHGYQAAGVDFVGEAVGRARASAEAAAAGEEDETTTSSAAVAFAACDVMTAHPLTCWDDVRRMEEMQLRRQLLPPEEEEEEEEEDGEAASAAVAEAGRFALLFDCQTWHVLRLEAAGEGAVVARYRRLLQPGGVLLLLCGRRPEGDEDAGDAGDTGRREDGPNVVSLAELRRAFTRERGWLEREVVATRFDPTPAYERRPGGPPLAWAAVFEAVEV